MPTKPLDRLMFAQGNHCFFCGEPLAKADASVEHLVASANGGTNADDNCVACCKSINRVLGSKSVKEKFQIVLKQNGRFKCPNAARPANPLEESIAHVVEDLRRRGTGKPKKMSTLTGTIRTRLKREGKEGDADMVLEELRTRGVVIVHGTKISYAL